MTSQHPDTMDPRFTAALTLLGRTGARAVQIRYDDDPQPTVWVVDVEYRDGRECAGGMTPLAAVLRLLDLLIDGGTCTHCRRPSGVEHDFRARLPLAEH